MKKNIDKKVLDKLALEGEKEWKSKQIKELKFIDGVLVTWEIFNRILDKRLRDENGELEKDNNGCDYLGIINDDVTDLLLSKVLDLGYFKTRGYQLIYQFGIELN